MINISLMYVTPIILSYICHLMRAGDHIMVLTQHQYSLVTKRPFSYHLVLPRSLLMYEEPNFIII
jgi:hypothetical protein